MKFDRHKLRKIAISRRPAQPFRTKLGSIAKNYSKIAIARRPAQPFRTKWGSIAKNYSKIAIARQPAQPGRTKWGLIAQTAVKLRLQGVRRNPFARNEVRSPKTTLKWQAWHSWSLEGAKRDKDEKPTARGAKQAARTRTPPARSAETRRRREATQTTSTHPGQGGICTMVLKPLKVKPVHAEWL